MPFKFLQRVLSKVRDHPIQTYLVVVAITVLPLILFLVAAHQLLNRQATAGVLAQASDSGKLLSTLLEEQLTNSETFLESFAVRPDVLQDWRSKNYGALSAQLKALHALRPEFMGLSMVGVDGRLKATDPPGPEAFNQDLSSRDWYGGIQRDWKPYVSAVYPSDAPGQPLIVAVAVPVLDAEKQPVAILVARQTLVSATSDIFQVLRGANATLAFLVDQKGQVFGRQTATGPVMLMPADHELSETVLNGIKNSPGKMVSVGGKSYITSITPLPAANWAILVKVPVSAIKAAVWAHEGGLAFLGGIIILFAVTGGALIAWLYKRFRTAEKKHLEQIEVQNLQLQERTAALEETNSELEAFSYSVSHDLRSPLHGISGYASVLIEDHSAGLPPKACDYLSRIVHSVRRMDILINDLLAFSRVSRQYFPLEKVSLAAAVKDAREQLESDIARSGAEITTAGHFPEVIANQALLAQVITNLLSNAVKFVPEGRQPRIEISSERRQHAVRLSVQDNGIGIPDQYRDKVSQPFERLHAQGQYPGSGLGLAIVTKAVLRMTGSFGFDSRPGEGSRFWIEVPGAEQQLSS